MVKVKNEKQRPRLEIDDARQSAFPVAEAGVCYLIPHPQRREARQQGPPEVMQRPRLGSLAACNRSSSLPMPLKGFADAFRAEGKTSGLEPRCSPFSSRTASALSGMRTEGGEKVEAEKVFGLLGIGGAGPLVEVREPEGSGLFEVHCGLLRVGASTAFLCPLSALERVGWSERSWSSSLPRLGAGARRCSSPRKYRQTRITPDLVETTIRDLVNGHDPRGIASAAAAFLVTQNSGDAVSFRPVLGSRIRPAPRELRYP